MRTDKIHRSVYLPIGLIEAITDLAQVEGRSFNNIVIRYLEAAISWHTNPNTNPSKALEEATAGRGKEKEKEKEKEVVSSPDRPLRTFFKKSRTSTGTGSSTSTGTEQP